MMLYTSIYFLVFIFTDQQVSKLASLYFCQSPYFILLFRPMSPNHVLMFLSKGGEQSPDSRELGYRKMAPNGQNDLKFCMQGAFVRLY